MLFQMSDVLLSSWPEALALDLSMNTSLTSRQNLDRAHTGRLIRDPATKRQMIDRRDELFLRKDTPRCRTLGFRAGANLIQGGRVHRVATYPLRIALEGTSWCPQHKYEHSKLVYGRHETAI